MSKHAVQRTMAFNWPNKSILFFLILTGGFFSCNNTNQNAKVQALTSDSASLVGTSDNTSTKSHLGVNFTFRKLYLLKKDFNAFFANGSGNKAIDLEFYFPKDAPDGAPTLGVWPTRGNHQFDTTDKHAIMRYADTSGVKLPDSIFLGSNEFVPSRQLINSMANSTACPDACVLYFVPLPGEHLHFDVQLIPDSTQIISQGKNISPFPKAFASVGTTNPSPPRSATQ